MIRIYLVLSSFNGSVTKSNKDKDICGKISVPLQSIRMWLATPCSGN
jgi:hypothetical protein